MCGRYRRTTAEEEIARQFKIPIPPQLDLPISYNVTPNQNIVAVRRNPGAGQRTLDALRWGTHPKLCKGREDRLQCHQRPGGDRRYGRFVLRRV
jgi:putative SOS response-associated peptidase YedK